MLIRSITLSSDTFDAWKAIGGWFPRRDRTPDEMLDLYANNYDPTQPAPIINLGNTGFSPTESDLEARGIQAVPIFNLGDNIRPLVRPGTTRKLLNHLLPPYPRANRAGSRFWIKAPGSKGKGKTLTFGDALPKVPAEWDLQAHVVGAEYRVITVDDKVVQVNQRQGDNKNRSYQWVGVLSAPAVVKHQARVAARQLSGRNILGWDVIHVPGMQKAYILEGNSCPGVNPATAQRIIDFIEERTYEDAS